MALRVGCKSAVTAPRHAPDTGGAALAIAPAEKFFSAHKQRPGTASTLRPRNPFAIGKVADGVRGSDAVRRRPDRPTASARPRCTGGPGRGVRHVRGGCARLTAPPLCRAEGVAIDIVALVPGSRGVGREVHRPMASKMSALYRASHGSRAATCRRTRMTLCAATMP